METINWTGSISAPRKPWNKDKLIGPKPFAAAEARLGDSDTVAALRAQARFGALQFGD
jgi:hypothetical protein